MRLPTLVAVRPQIAINWDRDLTAFVSGRVAASSVGVSPLQVWVLPVVAAEAAQRRDVAAAAVSPPLPGAAGAASRPRLWVE
jgi:hypothetical protein